MQTQEKSCGAVVYYVDQDENHYLLICHRNGGHWAFAKGHVEAGETEIETAQREIQEETGLNVTIDPRFRTSVSYSPSPGVQKEVVYFVAESSQLTVTQQIEEVTNVLWLPYSLALERLTYENDRDILTQAQQYLLTKEGE